MKARGKESPAPAIRLAQPRGRTRGKIYSYTRVQEPPAGFEAHSPYCLALVRLEDGSLITAQLTDVDEPIEIGAEVEMATRKLTSDGRRGVIVYGYKFRPVM